MDNNYFRLKCHCDIILFSSFKQAAYINQNCTNKSSYLTKQTLPNELQTYRPVLTLMPLIFLCPPNAFLTLIFSGLSSLSWKDNNKIKKHQTLSIHVPLITCYNFPYNDNNFSLLNTLSKTNPLENHVSHNLTW